MAHQTPRRIRQAGRRASATGRDSTLIVEKDGALIGDLYLHVEDAWSQVEVRDQAAGDAGRDRLSSSTRRTPARGYATEAVREELRICFEDVGVRRVIAQGFADNVPSRRLMERRRHAPRGSTPVKESLHRDG